MVVYRLTVVGAPDGGFLVNKFQKAPYERVSDLTAVLTYMRGLDHDVLGAKPFYQKLKSEDLTIIEGLRKQLANGAA